MNRPKSKRAKAQRRARRAEYQREMGEQFEERLNAVKIREYAPCIANQAQLELILLQVKRRVVRREVYEVLKPHLAFVSEYTVRVSEPDEIPAYTPVSDPVVT